MSELPLKNYTSTVPVHQTLAQIERMIAQAGAMRIQKEYGPRAELAALLFTIPAKNGQAFTIRLPADSGAIFEMLWSEIRRPRPETRQRIQKQAERTAWKLMSEWCQIQFSLIKLQNREPLEVFLPYVWDAATHRTLFQVLESSNFKALPAPHEQNPG